MNCSKNLKDNRIIKGVERRDDRTTQVTGAVLVFLLFISFSSCSRILGGLRKDIDESAYSDAPTVGGKWAERGMLANEEYSKASKYGDQYSGLANRGPAGLESINQMNNRSQGWISEAQRESNRRDMYRGMNLDQEDIPTVTYSQVQNFRPPTNRMYKNGARATKSDFQDDSTGNGSLWGDEGQSNFFFSKNKIRAPGDIVTVTIEDGLVKDMGYEVRRTLTPPEREQELLLADKRLKLKSDDEKLKTSSAAPSTGAKKDAKPEEKNLGEEAREVNYTDIDVAQSLEVKAGETMMGEIVERYPNGNYKIRAVKKVVYKNGPPRMVTLMGIAKGGDISEEDVIVSSKLYEYRLEASR